MIMRTRKDFDNAVIGGCVVYEGVVMGVANKSPKWITLRDFSNDSLVYVRYDWLPEELPEKEVSEERRRTKNVEESLASFNKAIGEHL